MEVDIYGDLDSLDNQFDTIRQENEQLKETVQKLEETSIKFSIELSELKRINANLELNISSLYKTAKSELERKSREIAELRKNLDNMLFKRGSKGKKPPKIENEFEEYEVKIQYARAQNDIKNKNRIISNLNTELEKVRNELQEQKLLKRTSSQLDEDNEHNINAKRQKMDRDPIIENEEEYRNYRNRFEQRENSHHTSRSRSPYHRNFSRGARNNDLRTQIELKKLNYRRNRSKSRDNFAKKWYNKQNFPPLEYEKDPYRYYRGVEDEHDNGEFNYQTTEYSTEESVKIESNYDTKYNNSHRVNETYWSNALDDIHKNLSEQNNHHASTFSCESISNNSSDNLKNENKTDFDVCTKEKIKLIDENTDPEFASSECVVDNVPNLVENKIDNIRIQETKSKLGKDKPNFENHTTELSVSNEEKISSKVESKPASSELEKSVTEKESKNSVAHKTEKSVSDKERTESFVEKKKKSNEYSTEKIATSEDKLESGNLITEKSVPDDEKIRSHKEKTKSNKKHSRKTSSGKDKSVSEKSILDKPEKSVNEEEKIKTHNEKIKSNKDDLEKVVTCENKLETNYSTSDKFEKLVDKAQTDKTKSNKTGETSIDKDKSTVKVCKSVFDTPDKSVSGKPEKLVSDKLKSKSMKENVHSEKENLKKLNSNNDKIKSDSSVSDESKKLLKMFKIPKKSNTKTKSDSVPENKNESKIMKQEKPVRTGEETFDSVLCSEKAKNTEIPQNLNAINSEVNNKVQKCLPSFPEVEALVQSIFEPEILKVADKITCTPPSEQKTDELKNIEVESLKNVQEKPPFEKKDTENSGNNIPGNPPVNASMESNECVPDSSHPIARPQLRGRRRRNVILKII